LGGRGRSAKRGFTLVEVIVVLVILAILAAIAIPALTGYIDKARLKDIELLSKTRLTAIQTMISERYGEYGGIEGHLTEFADAFGAATGPNVFSDGQPYFALSFTNLKWQYEYEKLTGDTYSFRSHVYGKNHQAVYVWINASGGIEYLGYYDNSFVADSDKNAAWPMLRVWYFSDINSAAAEYMITSSTAFNFASFQAGKDFGLKTGFNIIEESNSAKPGCFKLLS
jgi:prepilin-type N-terminal cleavage/methylation domain-containing protein